MTTRNEARLEETFSAERTEAFGAEIEAIRKRVLSRIGDSDARYIRGIVSMQRVAEVGGRALLFAGVFPPAWGAGVGLLAFSKVLENMEVGHNVMHGQYDWMNEPALSGARYEWDLVCPGDQWRHSHNYMHHTFTNIVGKDRDVGYGFLRVADEQPWNQGHLFQPLSALALMLVFEWGVALHDLELDHVMSGKKTLRAALSDSKPIARKAARQMLKDYVLFPLLAGPAAPLVLAGNASANVMRNIWAFLIIFCGHFPEEVSTYSADEVGRRRAEPGILGRSEVRQTSREGAGSTSCRGTSAIRSSITSFRMSLHVATQRSRPRSRRSVGSMESRTRRARSRGRS